MKRTLTAAVCAFLLSTGAAFAQLEPFEDYDVSEAVWSVTTVKIHPNMGDDYLEGIQQTWAAANELAKELGHIEDYSIFTSELPQSGDFNLVLSVKFSSIADLGPDKEKYDAFMERWGEEMQDRSREISKDYPSMRDITGQYLLRELTLK